MKKFKAIIFDLDGTIIDTEKIWKAVTLDVVASQGVELSENDRCYLEQEVHGLAMKEACQKIIDLCKIDHCVDAMVEKKKMMAAERYKKELTFIEGFIDFHARIPLHAMKIAIATNSDDHNLSIASESLKLSGFFGEHIYGISCVGNVCKPKPDIYHYVAQKLECYPAECVVIEDSAHGIKAAKAAGMYCIGINTSNDLDQLKEADEIINHYHELLGRLK
jgi:HAD superfamily hydrolase (TIGR01509 family)